MAGQQAEEKTALVEALNMGARALCGGPAYGDTALDATGGALLRAYADRLWQDDTQLLLHCSGMPTQFAAGNMVRSLVLPAGLLHPGITAQQARDGAYVTVARSGPSVDMLRSSSVTVPLDFIENPAQPFVTLHSPAFYEALWKALYARGCFVQAFDDDDSVQDEDLETRTLQRMFERAGIDGDDAVAITQRTVVAPPHARVALLHVPQGHDVLCFVWDNHGNRSLELVRADAPVFSQAVGASGPGGVDPHMCAIQPGARGLYPFIDPATGQQQQHSAGDFIGVLMLPLLARYISCQRGARAARKQQLPRAPAPEPGPAAGGFRALLPIPRLDPNTQVFAAPIVVITHVAVAAAPNPTTHSEQLAGGTQIMHALATQQRAYDSALLAAQAGMPFKCNTVAAGAATVQQAFSAQHWATACNGEHCELGLAPWK